MNSTDREERSGSRCRRAWVSRSRNSRRVRELGQRVTERLLHGLDGPGVGEREAGVLGEGVQQRSLGRPNRRPVLGGGDERARGDAVDVHSGRDRRHGSGEVCAGNDGPLGVERIIEQQRHRAAPEHGACPVGDGCKDRRQWRAVRDRTLNL